MQCKQIVTDSKQVGVESVYTVRVCLSQYDTAKKYSATQTAARSLSAEIPV